MAFWLKKDMDKQTDPNENKEIEKSLQKSSEDKKKQARRIDNLRIPQQLRITMRSLGTQSEYPFHTKDLSATGAFVLCNQLKHYPFIVTSTILDCRVELKEFESLGGSDMRTGDGPTYIKFMAKIARVVEAHGEGSTAISGFGIRIVQISNEFRNLLEGFIAQHGHVDPSELAEPA